MSTQTFNIKKAVPDVKRKVGKPLIRVWWMNYFLQIWRISATCPTLSGWNWNHHKQITANWHFSISFFSKNLKLYFFISIKRRNRESKLVCVYKYKFREKKKKKKPSIIYLLFQIIFCRRSIGNWRLLILIESQFFLNFFIKTRLDCFQYEWRGWYVGFASISFSFKQ